MSGYAPPPTDDAPDVESATVFNMVEHAILRPRHYTGRGKSESMHAWQSRAVVLALIESGFMIESDDE